MGRPRKYNTEEERIAAIRAQRAKWNREHKTEMAEYWAEWRKNSPEYYTEYRSTPYGRANHLLSRYRQSDKKYNRGECIIDAQWIVDNVFSGQVCHYCGETDWRKLGVDRKDSSLPHTPENCVPCCKQCNKIKGTTPYDEFIKKDNGLGNSPIP